MTAATTLIPSITPTCTTPCGATVGVGLATTGRLSAVKVSWRAVSMAVTTAGSPPAAAGTMFDQAHHADLERVQCPGCPNRAVADDGGRGGGVRGSGHRRGGGADRLEQVAGLQGRDERARCGQDGNGHGHRALHEERAVDELITQEACEAATAPEVPEPRGAAASAAMPATAIPVAAKPVNERLVACIVPPSSW